MSLITYQHVTTCTIFLTGLLVEDNVPMQVHNATDKSLVKSTGNSRFHTQNFAGLTHFMELRSHHLVTSVSPRDHLQFRKVHYPNRDSVK